MSAKGRRSVRAALADLVKARFGTGPVALPRLFNVGVGTKPLSGG
jgi:hypothetical protein